MTITSTMITEITTIIVIIIIIIVVITVKHAPASRAIARALGSTLPYELASAAVYTCRGQQSIQRVTSESLP
jgi:hypothetical protein